MKITRVEPTLISVPFDEALASPTGRKRQDAVYVRVETDAGVTGWGEAFGFGACAMSYLALLHVVAPLAVGRDPTDIDTLMTDLRRRTQNMSRNGPVAYALSALDIALWDIAGKIAGKALHVLLGGMRKTEIPAYASLLRLGAPDEVARVARLAVDRGYKHIKLHERTVEAVAAARTAVGSDIGLMLDTNCSWDLNQAVKMAAALQPYDLAWLEEPVYPPDDFDALATLRAQGVMPIAAGENLGNIQDVRHILDAGAVDIVQPDVAKMGGVTEMMKALPMARSAGIKAEPHSPLYGPALIATLHIIAALPEDVMCEFYFADMDATPIGDIATPKDGVFGIPRGPGLGIDVDEDVLKRYRVTLKS
ncbi:MAG TPA: mandelate racemase/muconate lactonizing enzyme family protein [Xanthobacteraceae bacterium]|jgi:D-galactarolactone cycloisomerase|nr:mandelate racemase/muconate lactonizing enzyme family protein [Xanthobacteraceae bacterium]